MVGRQRRRDRAEHGRWPVWRRTASVRGRIEKRACGWRAGQKYDWKMGRAREAAKPRTLAEGI